MYLANRAPREILPQAPKILNQPMANSIHN